MPGRRQTGDRQETDRRHAAAPLCPPPQPPQAPAGPQLHGAAEAGPAPDLREEMTNDKTKRIVKNLVSYIF